MEPVKSDSYDSRRSLPPWIEAIGGSGSETDGSGDSDGPRADAAARVRPNESRRSGQGGGTGAGPSGEEVARSPLNDLERQAADRFALGEIRLTTRTRRLLQIAGITGAGLAALLLSREWHKSQPDPINYSELVRLATSGVLRSTP